MLLYMYMSLKFLIMIHIYDSISMFFIDCHKSFMILLYIYT